MGKLNQGKVEPTRVQLSMQMKMTIPYVFPLDHVYIIGPKVVPIFLFRGVASCHLCDQAVIVYLTSWCVTRKRADECNTGQHVLVSNKLNRASQAGVTEAELIRNKFGK